MSARSLDELRDLAPGFVMETLTLEERADFERALRDPSTTAALTEELSAMREILGVVAGGTAAAPPTALRARVLDRIADEARTAAPAPAASTAPSAPATVVPITSAPSASRGGWAIPTILTLAAAASTAIAVGLNSDLRRLRAELATQVALLDTTRATLAQRDTMLRTLTDAGNDLVLVRLAPNVNDGPSMQVYWNVKRGAAVVMASGLKQLATDRAYVLWMIRDGKPAAVALFRPDASGSQVLSDIQVPVSAQGVAAFAVTEEAATGATQPTMTPFLVGTVGTK